MRKQNYILLKDTKIAKKQLLKSEKYAKNIAKSILNYKSYSRLFRILGPGVVTGAADDDPSGTFTYSQTGAIYGFSMLWAFPLMYPMLLAVQESCSRIGAVTGKGMAAVIKENYSRKLLYFAVFLVVTANVVNIGADFSAMVAVTQLFVKASYSSIMIFYASIILLMVIFMKYRQYSKILKWLALSLLAYPVAAILVGQNWSELLRATFVINFQPNFTTIYLLVGLLGTTISPYLFFWDTSEVVEDEIESHRLAENARREPRISKRFIKNVRLDNFIGMTIASVVAWFIVVTCASVLNANGITEIKSVADAAAALEPLARGSEHAGLIAKALFSIGIVGIGLLAVPILAGSSSYAVSEAIGIKEGLHNRFKKAMGFYVFIILAVLAGMGINFMGINPIQALVFAAVLNGIAAIPLLFMISRIGRNENIMGQYKNSLISNIVINITFLVMLLAAGFLLFSFFM